MGNDYLECSTIDCNEHRFQFNSLIQFKKEETIEQLKNMNIPENVIDERFGVIDYTLKEQCKSEAWCNAFIMLLMRYYKNQPLSIPQINNNDDDDNEQPLICRIFNKYDITNNEKDIILACDIESIFGNEKKKLADELKALGVTRKNVILEVL